jgi:hypothetical protein
MQDEEKGTHWMVWVLVVAVSMATGALAVKWVLGSRPEPVEQAAAPASAPAAPEPFPAAAGPARDTSQFDLPGDEQDGDSSVVWGKTPGASRETAGAPESAATSAPAAPADAKKSRQLGLVKNALSAAAEKLLDSPKALAALFNNDYVVKGFLSRDTVRGATANKAALAAYLKNPANLSAFMAKPVVQRGLKNQELVGVMASTKLVGALLDSPGGKALLADEKLFGEVIRDNPDLALVLANPGIAAAMAKNPKTAGVLGAVGR